MNTPNRNFKPTIVEPYQPWPKHWLWLLTAGLIAWAVIHAVGSSFGGTNHQLLQVNANRGLVVICCMALFLGSWALLLRNRKPRKLKYRLPAASAPDEPLPLVPESNDPNPYASPQAIGGDHAAMH